MQSIERTNLLKKLKYSESIILWGEIQSGKTHLLREIEETLVNRLDKYHNTVYIPIFVDLNSIQDGLFEIFGLIIEGTIEKLSNLEYVGVDFKENKAPFVKSILKNVNRIDARFFVDVLKNLISDIANFETRIIPIFDNVETFVERPENSTFLSNLRHITSESEISNSFLIIISGGIRFYKKEKADGSPLSNSVSIEYISNYRSTDILEFLEKNEMRNDTFEDILINKCGCNSYLINNILTNEIRETTDEELIKNDIINKLLDRVFSKLDEKSIEIFEKVVFNEEINLASLMKFGFTHNELLYSTDLLRVCGLIEITSDDGQLYYRPRGKIIPFWFIESDMDISKHIDTGHSETDIHIKRFIPLLQKIDAKCGLDTIELLNYFGSRHIIHSRQKEFLVTKAEEFLEKEEKAQKAMTRFEVDFFQPHLYSDMLSDRYIAKFVQKEPEIHGGAEDVIFQKRGVKIPIEFKAIYRPDEKRPIEVIVKRDYLNEILQHAQNSPIGFLCILDMRPPEEPNDISKCFYAIDSEGKYIFVIIFKNYKIPSAY